MALSKKQEKFVHEYVTNKKHAVLAYRLAGYYSVNENSANVGASRLLKSANIAHEIARLKVVQAKKDIKTIKKTEVDQAYIVAEYIDVIQSSKARKQYGVANQAITNLAKLLNIGSLNSQNLNVSGEINHLQQLDTQSLLNALIQSQDDKIIDSDNVIGC